MAKGNVILFAAGSYNPPTHMHLRMFEIAKDFLHQSGRFQVLGGIISPVHDDYKKESLSEANATHRCSMVNLCLRKNPFIKLSTYETEQKSWTRLRIVLEEHKRLLMTSTNEQTHSWIPEQFNPKESFKILFLCGADLLESFNVPGLWLDEDIEVIVKDFGLVVISREGSNPEKFIYNSDILTNYKSNIHIVTEWITNDVSSTKVRRAVRRHESVKYLIPDEVIQYISEHGLYSASKNEYSSLIEPLSQVISTSCLQRSEEVSSLSHCPSFPNNNNNNNNVNESHLGHNIDSFDSDDDAKENSISSSSSSVQSRLSLIKSSPVLGEMQDEIVSPSDDEMSPLEREFNHREARLSPPIQGNMLPLIDETDERSGEEDSSIKESMPGSSYNLEVLKEALILDEKNALVEETERFIEEIAEESVDFHILNEKHEEVRVVLVDDVVNRVEVLENPLPIIEECPKTAVSPDVTDSLSNEELDKTVIENSCSEKSLTTKDSLDLSDMPPPPLPYSESPELENMDSEQKSYFEDEINQYVVVDKARAEEFEAVENEEEITSIPAPPSTVSTPKSDKKAPKKSEDKVQIEITKKGIIVISEKESFL